MTHTPGPWTTGSDKKGDEYTFCIVQNKSWRGQQFIARVEPYGVWDGLEEAEANARLIAASPELLEALDCLLDQTVDQDLAFGIELTEGEKEARDKALSAIAKANGKAT